MASSGTRGELEDLQSRIGDDLVVMSFGELAGRFKSAGTLSRNKVLALAQALGHFISVWSQTYWPVVRHRKLKTESHCS